MVKINNILILLITSIILFFTIDYIHNNHIKNKVDEKFNNIDGPFNRFNNLANQGIDIVNNDVNTLKPLSNIDFNGTERKTYYKQYLYKLLSANDSDKIIKLNLTNNSENVNIDIVFNNVLDHEKANEDGSDINNAVIKDNTVLDDETTIYDIEKDNCEYNDNNYDNNDYSWTISNLNDDLNKFEITFTQLNIIDGQQKTYVLTFTLNNSLMSLYDNIISFKQMLSNTLLSGMTLSVNGDTAVDITTYFVSNLNFSDFTVNRLKKYHINMEDTIETEILADAHSNLREFNKIRNDINKLENYYKFQKSLKNDYTNYKTL